MKDKKKREKKDNDELCEIIYLSDHKKKKKVEKVIEKLKEDGFLHEPE